MSHTSATIGRHSFAGCDAVTSSTIANAILADQSGADHGEAAQGHQPAPATARSSRAHGHATALRASHRHNQAMSHT